MHVPHGGLEDQESNTPASRPVLIFVTNSKPAFVNHKLDLVRGLLGDHEVLLLSGETSEDPTEIPGIRVNPLPLSRYRHLTAGDIKTLWLLLREFQKRHPVAIVSFSLKANILTAAAEVLKRMLGGPRTRLVLVNPGLGRVFDRNKNGSLHQLRKSMVIKVLKFLVRKTEAHAVFENRDDRDTWVGLDIVPDAQTHVKNGTGVALPDQPVPEKDASCFRIVFASRMLKSKGILPVLKAAQLLEGREDIQFELFGDASASDADHIALDKIALPSNVRWYGQQPFEKVADALQRAQCVCLPSVYMEGIPRILLEGAVHKCALVACDIPGCREIVRQGETGFLLTPNDDDTLARELAQVIEHLASNITETRKTGERAYRMIRRDGYDVDAVRSDFERLIRSQIAARPDHGNKLSP